MSVKEGFDLNRYQFIIHSTQLELLDLGQEPHYKHYRAEYFKQVLGIKKKGGGGWSTDYADPVWPEKHWPLFIFRKTLQKRCLYEI